MPKYRNRPTRPLTKKEWDCVCFFFDENSKYIHYIYSLFSADKDNEDDVIQECYLRITYNIDTFLSLDEVSRKKYIVPIIKNLCIDAARKKNKMKTVPLDDSIAIEEPQFSDTYMMLDLLASELPDADWRLLKELYLDGTPKEELAKSMNCGVDSLRVLASRARKRARRIIEYVTERGRKQ